MICFCLCPFEGKACQRCGFCQEVSTLEEARLIFRLQTPAPRSRLSSSAEHTAWHGQTICSVLPSGEGSVEGGQDALAGATLFMFPLPHPGKPRVPTLTEAGRSPWTPHLSGLLTNDREAAAAVFKLGSPPGWSTLISGSIPTLTVQKLPWDPSLS